jgi:uncharacterized protein (TIGR02147 family)
MLDALMTQVTTTDYRDYILREFERRQKKNPSYSLRAFARDLEIPCSRLSEILNRKRGLSQRRAPALADKLYLSPSEKEYFVDLALCEHARSGLVKNMAVKRINARKMISAQYDENVFSVIADWYHHVMLEYLQLPNADQSIEAISAQYGIQPGEVERALERLEKVNLIHKEENGRWTVNHQHRTAAFHANFDGMKRYYSQLMSKVTDNIGKESRAWNMSASTVQIKKSAFPQVVEKLTKFRQELLAELESSPDRDAVCCLTMQFFDFATETNQNTSI